MEKISAFKLEPVVVANDEKDTPNVQASTQSAAADRFRPSLKCSFLIARSRTEIKEFSALNDLLLDDLFETMETLPRAKQLPEEFQPEALAWCQRTYDAVNMSAGIGLLANEALDNEADGRDDSTALHFVLMSAGGKPAGSMVLEPYEDEKALTIRFLCTHPLSATGGRLLIEKAEEISGTLGFEGRLQLISIPGAKPFYEYLGFKNTSAIRFQNY